MGFRFDTDRTVEHELRRVAGERLDDALDALARIAAESAPVTAPVPDGATASERDVAVDALVHEVCKRCKEVRGLLRLVGPALGDDARTAASRVAAAAGELAASRDAAAVAAAHRALTGSDVPGLAAPSPPDPDAVARALALLSEVRDASLGWTVPDRFPSVGRGLRATYRQGRRRMRAAEAQGTPEAYHRWRSSAKRLWYQLRLLEPVAPGLLAPMVALADRLGEALGDDHDLAVLIDRGEADGSFDPATLAAARQRREELEALAHALGARLYAESPDALVARVRAYWRSARRLGPEPAPVDRPPAAVADAAHGGPIERERKFLVADGGGRPPLPAAGMRLRQGYLARHPVAVRVRDVDGREFWLTAKAGGGAVRTEVERALTADEFEALWPATTGQRIDKTRYLVPLGDHVAELDVFAGDLAGLELVEVEFGDEVAMARFRPPPWFGEEVTDDPRYSNAALAVDGDPRHTA